MLDDAAGLALRGLQGCDLVTAILPRGTDSVFNRIHGPRLISEIRDVADRVDDRDVRDQLISLASFVGDRIPPEADVYVIFVAD